MPKSTTRSCAGQNSRDGVNCLSITQRNDRLPGMAHWLPTVAGSAEDAGMDPTAVPHRQLIRTPFRIPSRQVALPAPTYSPRMPPSRRGNGAVAGRAPRGPHLYDWVVASLPSYQDAIPPGWSRWLRVCRSLNPNAGGEHELVYYLCCAPAGTSDEEAIRVAGACPVGDQGVLPDREKRGRAGSVPGPPLRRLVPAHHPGHARARLPGRHGGDHPKSPGGGLIGFTLGEVRRLLAHPDHHR